MSKQDCNKISGKIEHMIDGSGTAPENQWHGKSFETAFCRNINKIQGIADLFFSVGEAGSYSLSSEGAFGIHYSLEDAAKELRHICYEMLEVSDAN